MQKQLGGTRRPDSFTGSCNSLNALMRNRSMIEIPLTQNQVALIDDDDYELVSKRTWRAQWNPSINSFYAITSIRKPDGKWTALLMHRLIKDAQRGEQGDHIHHLTLDNRRSELRLCTQSQNMCNIGKREDNTSGYKGVCWNKHKQKWQAQIRVNGKRKNLGYFDTPELVHEAYCKAVLDLHGDFAKTA